MNLYKNLGQYSQKGAIPWNKGKKGFSAWNKGKVGVYSERTLAKMSESAIKVGKGKHMKGKPKSKDHKRKLSILASLRKGEISSNWKGGISKNYHIYNAIHRARLLKAEGKYTQDEWLDLKKIYKNTCPSCLRKEPEIKLTIDHIVPLTKNGANNIANIQPLCQSCNSRKHTQETKFNFI